MRKFLPVLAIALMVITVFGTIYGTVQQAQRSGANSPQIQLAEDTAAALNNGDAPLILVHGRVNMAKSLAPFTIVYDKKGHVVIGSGYLGDTVPKASLDMLSAAQGEDYSAVTWEPKDGVRIAAVTVAAKGYYVLSGRSLTEVEKNETQTLQLALIGGLISLLLLGGIVLAAATNPKAVESATDY